MTLKERYLSELRQEAEERRRRDEQQLAKIKRENEQAIFQTKRIGDLLTKTQSVEKGRT